MDKEIVGTAGFKYSGAAYVVKRMENIFNIVADVNFVIALTDLVKTTEGTVGDMHRKYLHKLLDEWIDSEIKKEDKK